MTRGSTISWLLVGALVSGCLLDPKAGRRPARFHAGPTTRALSVPVRAPDGVRPLGGGVGRSAPAPAAEQQLGATSVAMQFALAMTSQVYTAIEAETGRLHLPGSNLAVASAVVGVEQPLGFGSVGAELAIGWQSIRYHSGADEDAKGVAESRIRGQLWIAEQWTLGATFGTRLGGDRHDDWMAGAYLGVHSHRF